MPDLLPGDVVCVRTPLTFPVLMIRLGCLLRLRRPVDHVAVVCDIYPDGTIVVVEGRPSGVGYAPLSRYKLMSDNRAQPKTAVQRDQILADARSAIGTRYDWLSIAANVLTTLTPLDPDAPEYTATGRPPQSVICSSFPIWLYTRAGLPHPAMTSEDRFTAPWTWDDWIGQRGWERVPVS